MGKHTCELKDTIEYKVYSNRLKLTLSIALIYFSIVIGSIISLFCSVLLDYALQFALACCVVYLPFFCILIYLPIKWHKKRKLLMLNYDSYEEMEVLLSIPIKVRGSMVKYVIKIVSSNGREQQIESHIYNEALITGNRMLLGYNSEIKEVIFLKNIQKNKK